MTLQHQKYVQIFTDGSKVDEKLLLQEIRLPGNSLRVKLKEFV